TPLFPHGFTPLYPSWFYIDNPVFLRRLKGGQDDIQGFHPLFSGNERRRLPEEALHEGVDHTALGLPAFLIGGDGTHPVLFHLAVGPFDDQRILWIGTDADQTLFAVKDGAVVLAGNMGPAGRHGPHRPVGGPED